MQSENEPVVGSRPSAVEPPWAQQVLADVATIRSRLTLIRVEADETIRRYKPADGDSTSVGPVQIGRLLDVVPMVEELVKIEQLLRDAESAAGVPRPAASRLRNWWHGGRVERARRLVQEADIRLVRVVPGQASEAANLSHAIKHGFRLAPADPIRLQLERLTGPWYAEHLDQRRHEVAEYPRDTGEFA